MWHVIPQVPESVNYTELGKVAGRRATKTVSFRAETTEISRPTSTTSGIGTLLLYFHSWKMAPGLLAIRFTYLVQ